MKQFNFSAWSMRDLAENTLTGGGYNYHDMKMTQMDGETVLAMADRKNVGHRVKFVEAFEDAAKGNRYRISVRGRLGGECSVDEKEVTVGIIELFALYPAFIHEPKTVTKKEWTTIEFTHTLADDSHSIISVEQSGNNTPLAENILVADIRTELVYRAERVEQAPDNRATLWLIGDSIACNYSATSVTKGWGMFIGEWLDDTRIKVCNMARQGFSTQSFINTDGLAIWSRVCREMREGDYLIVSLGINDFSSYEPERKVDEAQYMENLRAFADEASRRGVTLLFVTSTVTVEENPVVNFRRAFPEAMMRVAEEKRVPCLDLNSHMLAAIRAIEATEGYEYLVSTYYSESTKENGVQVPDKTHQREAGSRWVASMIADLLRDSDCTLRGYLK